MTVHGIVGRKQFLTALRGKRLAAADCLLTIRFGPTPAKQLSLGIVVRKKTAKKAAIRNRIRRLVRECVRLWAKEHVQEIEHSRLQSLIVGWLSAPKHPALIRLADIQTVLCPLLDNACRPRN